MIEHDRIQAHSEEIINFLKKTFQYRTVNQSVLQQKIINQAAYDRKISIDDSEIQAETERQRREHHLEKASDTLAWLSDQQVTPEEWEAGIRDRLLTEKLGESMFHKEVEHFFVENRLDYDRIVLYQIIVPYGPLAQEIFYEIEEDEMSFYEAAHLYDIDEDRRRRCGFEGVLYRWSLSPQLSTTIFRTPVGSVAEPIQTDRGYHILLPEEMIVAELNPTIRKEVIQRLFQDWLNSEMNYQLYNA
ncbi:MAG: peptidylprolyl isomerase [Alkalinema sp. CACIAM 70d]|nr:MAG: peptidylprolyl isomerase [Alkalinema sp. CACIAM 70d]